MLYWFIYGLFEIAITHEYISALELSSSALLSLARPSLSPPCYFDYYYVMIANVPAGIN